MLKQRYYFRICGINVWIVEKKANKKFQFTNTEEQKLQNIIS